MDRRRINRSVTLFKWIWHSYLQTALIPLIVVELIFIGLYFLTNSWSQKQTVTFLKGVTQKELIQTSKQESEIIWQQLASIAHTTEFYKAELTHEFAKEELGVDMAAYRLKYSPEGTYFTFGDRAEGGAAVFYSGIVPVGGKEKAKLSKVLKLEDLMKNIVHSEPLSTSVYFNSFDSLNVIYPYFDVINQYTPLIDITKYNFYYEADAKHNPDKKVKWTDVYLDPAGRGWMTSAIAPVYKGDFLEGVVGVDVTINTIISHVLSMDVPWQGYSMLIGKDGTILALPGEGEADWQVNELTSHHYPEAVIKDTFKPEAFNIYKREDLSHFAKQISENKEGFTAVTLSGSKREVSWATVPNIGWKLLIVVPREKIFENVEHIKQKLWRAGILMVLGLVIFYGILLFFLTKRAKIMSSRISNPLIKINQMVENIGKGDYYQPPLDLKVKELQDTSLHLVSMGKQLGIANKKLLSVQEELKEREASLQALINSIDDVILELDEKGTFLNVWANDEDELSKIFTSCTPCCIDCITEPKTAERLKRKIKQAIESKCPQTAQFMIITCRGARWFEARISLISETTRTVVATSRDITEFKAIEESFGKEN